MLEGRKPVQCAGDPGWGLSPGPPRLCEERGAQWLTVLPREADWLCPPCLRSATLDKQFSFLYGGPWVQVGMAIGPQVDI